MMTVKDDIRDNFIYQAASSLLNLFYPKLCVGCGSDIVSKDEFICIECIAELPLTQFFQHQQNPIEKIFMGRIPVVNAASYVYFTKDSVMQHLLHQLKYKGNKEVGFYFGQRMGEAARETSTFDDAEALVPLPLFFKKQKKRGYNQSDCICEGMSRAMNLPVWNDVIARKYDTETQTHKNRNERWQNIEGRFALTNESRIMGKHLLLVDDVLTTGATLEACGAELIKVPGVRLSIATLAYTTL